MKFKARNLVGGRSSSAGHARIGQTADHLDSLPAAAGRPQRQPLGQRGRPARSQLSLIIGLSGSLGRCCSPHARLWLVWCCANSMAAPHRALSAALLLTFCALAMGEHAQRERGALSVCSFHGSAPLLRREPSAQDPVFCTDTGLGPDWYSCDPATCTSPSCVCPSTEPPLTADGTPLPDDEIPQFIM